ncbi:phosphoglycerate mutase-like protein [Trametes maxima]|nr:phosphoglycerate mutase-like protein [Trametes maxima]
MRRGLYVSMQIVTGFFAQDDPKADAAAIGALPARFGLLDESPDRWSTLAKRVDDLNAAASDDTCYKLFFFVRHGEGHHNVAERKYGRESWDAKWSKLNTDGEIVWGPDPDLTSVGIAQAEAARRFWETERDHGVPVPLKQYASPLRRALSTWREIFEKSELLSPDTRRVTIVEYLREHNGEHSCDMRSPRTTIARQFEPPVYEFEDGFSEEDILWTNEREKPEHIEERARTVLGRIFAQDDETYIAITAHSGIINGFLAAMGRPRYGLPTGVGILPLVIKGHVRREIL